MKKEDKKEQPTIQYRRDLWRLFEHVATKDLGPVAELGVAEGNFSEDILQWPVPFPAVFLVDLWKERKLVKGDSANGQEWHNANHRSVISRTAKYGGRARILESDTTVAAMLMADRSMSLVYVDADHSYAGVMKDIRAWFPKLKKGGVMAFHDYQNPSYGVKQAVQEFCKEKKIQVYELPEDKPEDAGAYFYVD